MRGKIMVNRECSFCGTKESADTRLIAGDDVFICESLLICVSQLNNLMNGFAMVQMYYVWRYSYFGKYRCI